MNLYNSLTYVSILCLALGTYAFDEVKEQFTGHGLNAAWQRFIVNIL